MKGFSLFDSVHLTWLLAILLFSIMTIITYRKLSERGQKVLQLILFFALLILEISKQLYLIITDQYSYWSPPLHLCGLGMFVIGWHIFWPNRTTATILYSLTLPGAAIALLFPGWATDPIGSFLHIHSFTFHALLVVYVLMLLTENQLSLYLKDLWKAALFLAITVPVIYVYNAKFSTNFMFLNKPVANTPLQWLYDAVGTSGYLFGLIALVLVLWFILYSFFLFIQKKTASENK